MQEIFPHPHEGREASEIEVASAVAAEARRRADGRPWVFTNMVTTIDGAATVDGKSGGIGGPGDREIFSALRAEADVIVVGAQTVRAEAYRLARAPGGIAARHREQRGQGPRPRLCIVTRSPALADGPPLLDELPAPGRPAEDWQRPIIATVHHRPDLHDESSGRGYDPRFDHIEAGDEHVDLSALIAELGTRGMQRVLCEGGPSLLAQLGADDLVDEWNFTVAPIVAAGDSVRPLHAASPLGTRLRLDRLFLDDDSTMFARYLTERTAPS